MRPSLQRIYPYALVVFSAAAGWWLGSERYGLPTDFNIERSVTAPRLASLYQPVFGELAAFYALTDETEKQQAKAGISSRFAADPTIVAAYIEIRPAQAPVELVYAYSAAESQGEVCTMRSMEQLRAGLVRCSMDTGRGRRDILKFTRPIRETDELVVLATLKLDYPKLLRRLLDAA